MRWTVVLILTFFTAVSQSDMTDYPPIKEIKIDPKKSVLSLPITMGDKTYRFALDMDYSDIYVGRIVIDDEIKDQTGLLRYSPDSSATHYVPDLRFGSHQLANDYKIYSMSNALLKQYPVDQFDGVLGRRFIGDFIWRFTANSVAVYEKKYSDSRDSGSFVPLFQETAHYRVEEGHNVELTRVIISACLLGIGDPLRVYPSFSLRNQWSSVIGINDKLLEERFAAEPPSLSISSLQSACGINDKSLQQIYPLCQKMPYPNSPPFKWMQKDKVTVLAENISVIHQPENELLVGCPSLSVGLPLLAKKYGTIILNGLSYLHFEHYSAEKRLQPY
ncbi:hypothetical protein [Endozoicomonas arenosclerae]|uniref:hypothetical protein n=1 Tax=Endozoicomonas arenosclerae TaxID=1633495 RepID=UPI0007813FB3|nr:hypothetical protein [Endozoicomonas arenosclerae]